MNETNHWLQLFGEGGEGAAPGASEGEAGTSGADREASAQVTGCTWEQLKADPEFRAEADRILERNNAERTPGRPRSGAAESLSQEDFAAAALDPVVARHFSELERQAEALRTLVPGFDLGRELANPAFARLTAPGTGISVEDAFYALHRQELQQAAMQVAAQKTAQLLSDAVRSGSYRPREHGVSAQGASVTGFDYRAASPQQKAALKKRIREAAARGEKLYPGR